MDKGWGGGEEERACQVEKAACAKVLIQEEHGIWGDLKKGHCGQKGNNKDAWHEMNLDRWEEDNLVRPYRLW